jgi:SAM-dependent methyltransferase
MDVIDIFYRQFSGVETFNYFAFRFGQPRHLAALSMASLLLQTEGPVLDLACGLGHLTHFLTASDPARLVVGLDRDFFRLYVASQFLAPQASFVCAAADQPLPFVTGALGGVLCSDAFHYFPYRAASVREMFRMLDRDGLLTLCRFGNSEVEPREGYELTIDGYRGLLAGLPHTLLGENDLLDAYLKGQGPDLEKEAPEHVLRSEKWVSAVACRNPERFQPRIHFQHWPHGVGHLEVNPLYLAKGTAVNGDLELRFAFPSEWYEFENARYREYAAGCCHFTEETLKNLSMGVRPASADRYVDQFVLLGMPERYCSRTQHKKRENC